MKDIFKTYTDFSLLFFNAEKELDDARPYQLTPINWSKKDMKRLNIHENDNYCHLTYNGEKVSDCILRKGGITSSVKEFNEKRFVTFLLYTEAKYSDEIVKDCNLKSPYHLDCVTCVFDMEKHEVAYVAKDRFHDYLNIYGNLCTDAKRNGVLYLPTRTWVLDETEVEDVINCDKYLFAHNCKYGKGDKMYRVDKETGEVINCCSLK